MKIWRTIPVTIAAINTEKVENVIAWQDGKNRRILFMAGPKTTNLWLKGYRMSQQVVEFDTDLFTTGYTLLPCDVVLKQGDTFTAGFISKGAAAATYNLSVCYEETD